MVEVRLPKVALVAVMVASVGACTAQDRYHAVRNDNLHECDRTLSEIERERCRERVAPASYEEYQRLRATVPDQAEGGTRQSQP